MVSLEGVAGQMLLNQLQKQRAVIVELTERLARLEKVLTAQKALAD